MLKKRLIPSILLLKGRCVKGRRFQDFRDTGNPLTVARIYDAQGADELVFFDIAATAEGREITFDVISAVAEECFMPLCVGGGVRSASDIRELLLRGADKVSINTAAVEDPALLSEAAERFGNQCIVASIDVRGAGQDAEVYTHAGTRPTGLRGVEWAQRVVELGAGEVLITSIDREGTLEGYDLELVRAVSSAVSVPVIAHGGCGTLDHLVDAVDIGGADAVACASMLHFTDQSVIKARAHMQTYGVAVRIA